MGRDSEKSRRQSFIAGLPWGGELPGLAHDYRRHRTTRRANRKVRRALRSRLSIGRIGRRQIGAEGGPDRPYGRGEIVARFHHVRKWDHPPVFVIQGVHGSKKSELLDHLLYNFVVRRSWYVREELVAKVDFFAIDPQPAATFNSLGNQLAGNSSWIRRLRVPRLRRVEALLAREQLRAGAPPTRVSAVESDLGWLATMGLRVASVATGTPIPTPSPGSVLLRGVRGFWWQVSPTKAGRWARRFKRSLPDPLEGPDNLRRRMELLQAALGDALAADLHRATRRLVLPVHEVALFIDGYHRVERSAQPGFVVDFSQRVADLGARVLIVIACREQERWSKLADAQPDCEDFRIMKTSKRVEVHQLEPLSYVDCIHALSEDRVPAALVPELAQLSAGMPVALGLLGAAFGAGGTGSPRLRAMLEKLPDPVRTDGEWFAQFTRSVAVEMVADLDPELELHLRAAATQRNFDRTLLSTLLDDRFSDRCYERLIESKFVGTPRPSALLGVQESYRVRSFVREILAGDDSERIAVERWHRLANDRLGRLAERASHPELKFRLQAEALFHRLYTEPEDAKAELFQQFQLQLLASRTDRCEALLWIALDYNRTDERWRAMVLANAGKMYLARDRHPLAEERLTEAKQLVSLDDEDSWLAVTISLALAKCYRVQGRVDEARAEFALLSSRPDVHPVVAFQCKWSECLVARGSGHLDAAREAMEEARELLDPLLFGPDAGRHARAAESFGLGSLPRKRVHLVRLEADLARRSGDHVTAWEKVEEALAGYREDPEDGIEGHTELTRTGILRQEGDFEAAFELAQSIYADFTKRRPREPRGAGRALRCMAQALLGGTDPERARPMLEELAGLDPRLYPSGRPLGLFGQAELERLKGELGKARRLYRLSEQGVGGRGDDERCYAQLGLIELDRIVRPHMVNGEVRQLRSRPGVLEHPTLDFLVALLQVRAFGRDGDHVEAAERALDRFVRRPDRPSWALQTLTDTLAAIDAGTELPPLVFNLP